MQAQVGGELALHRIIYGAGIELGEDRGEDRSTGTGHESGEAPDDFRDPPCTEPTSNLGASEESADRLAPLEVETLDKPPAALGDHDVTDPRAAWATWHREPSSA